MNDLVFFIDRCLGKHFIVDALKQTGITVEIHDDHFSQSTLDTEWIPEIGRRGWIILTKDAKIGRNHLERQALARSRIRMFTLVSQNLSGEDMAEIFRIAIPNIQNFIYKHPAPFIAKVYRDSKVKVWKNATDLLDEIDS